MPDQRVAGTLSKRGDALQRRFERPGHDTLQQFMFMRHDSVSIWLQRASVSEVEADTQLRPAERNVLHKPVATEVVVEITVPQSDLSVANYYSSRDWQLV